MPSADHQISLSQRMQANNARIDVICASAPVVPVLTLENAEQALGVCTALVRGGLTVLEITLRSEYGLKAIKQLKMALQKLLLVPALCLHPNNTMPALKRVLTL